MKFSGDRELGGAERSGSPPFNPVREIRRLQASGRACHTPGLDNGTVLRCAVVILPGPNGDVGGRRRAGDHDAKWLWVGRFHRRKDTGSHVGPSACHL